MTHNLDMHTYLSALRWINSNLDEHRKIFFVDVNVNDLSWEKEVLPVVNKMISKVLGSERVKIVALHKIANIQFDK